MMQSKYFVNVYTHARHGFTLYSNSTEESSNNFETHDGRRFEIDR